MTRIANINIPDKKRLVISLTYIYGIGLSIAKKICKITNLSENIKVSDLTEDNLSLLRETIKDMYIVEGDLKKEVIFNIQKKKAIKCYQGIRHMKKLPVNGQNTHSNARTRKGKAVTIPGKKQARSKK